MTASSNWHKEGGFEYALFPAKTEKPESLIIYMHGIGSNAEHFDAHAQSIQDKIPGAEVIALQAPIELKDPAENQRALGGEYFDELSVDRSAFPSRSQKKSIASPHSCAFQPIWIGRRRTCFLFCYHRGSHTPRVPA